MSTPNEFSFVKASFDGGVALECWRDYDGSGNRSLLMMAQWKDEGDQFSVWTAEGELPFKIWEEFIQEARRWCPRPGSPESSIPAPE